MSTNKEENFEYCVEVFEKAWKQFEKIFTKSKIGMEPWYEIKHEDAVVAWLAHYCAKSILKAKGAWSYHWLSPKYKLGKRGDKKNPMRFVDLLLGPGLYPSKYKIVIEVKRIGKQSNEASSIKKCKDDLVKIKNLIDSGACSKGYLCIADFKGVGIEELNDFVREPGYKEIEIKHAVRNKGDD